ncbi:hypothetical protein CYMTET_22206 [Cymbomonas tetramitiformis]|uniref:Protein kinase domain-containing protein n=1 Tax=Cymbomonas tetramitiformis TaxID=36881 RepID=A0AAE0L275_9CHLO|nr:hypothetical protein CYMTET_22206 [Cymbomonas tetramitiformis]|eukprot:gene1059-1606_t
MSHTSRWSWLRDFAKVLCDAVRNGCSHPTLRIFRCSFKGHPSTKQVVHGPDDADMCVSEYDGVAPRAFFFAQRRYVLAADCSKLGGGAYGEVYCFVRDESTETRAIQTPTRLAMKISRCDDKDAILRECLDTTMLHDTSDRFVAIVPSKPLRISTGDAGSVLYDARIARDARGVFSSYCVMPTCVCDLHTFIQHDAHRARMLQLGEVGLLRILKTVLHSMRFLDDMGMIYADLKLSNILVRCIDSNGLPVCELGDVGSIASKRVAHKLLSTFPSPEYYTDGCETPQRLWSVAAFISEYSVNVHDSTHMKGPLYRGMTHVTRGSLAHSRDIARILRWNMQIMELSLPHSWKLVQKLHSICTGQDDSLSNPRLSDLIEIIEKEDDTKKKQNDGCQSMVTHRTILTRCMS